MGKLKKINFNKKGLELLLNECAEDRTRGLDIDSMDIPEELKPKAWIINQKRLTGPTMVELEDKINLRCEEV